jgi:hypothetical protein
MSKSEFDNKPLSESDPESELDGSMDVEIDYIELHLSDDKTTIEINMEDTNDIDNKITECVNKYNSDNLNIIEEELKDKYDEFYETTLSSIEDVKNVLKFYIDSLEEDTSKFKELVETTNVGDEIKDDLDYFVYVNASSVMYEIDEEQQGCGHNMYLINNTLCKLRKKRKELNK